jgi:hypothetical protein
MKHQATKKSKNGRIKRKNSYKKVIKEKGPKIKVLTHELLAYTVSYLMLAPW